MANEIPISGLTADSTPKGTDLTPITDTTDTTQAPTGTTKSVLRSVELNWTLGALGVMTQSAALLASTGALTVTYNNGTLGVGATLTNAGTQAVFSIDGVTPALNSRILINNQASTFQNGIYTVTNVGSASTNWVLTRATDFNQASNINQYTMVYINQGTVNAGLLFQETGAGPFTVGTTPITFAKYILANINNVTYPLGIAYGGTGVASVTVAPAATSWAGWDANKNFSANSFLSAYTTTATAASTTTLVVGSTYQQFFTGSTTQTVLLPVTSTLVLGQQFYIVNNSTGTVTVQSSGGNTIQAMAANTTLTVTCVLTSGTTAASWYADYNAQTEAAYLLAANNLSDLASSSTAVTNLFSGNRLPTASLPSGTMFNFQQGQVTTAAVFTPAGSWTDITSLSVAITPTSSSSTVLVRATFTASAGDANNVPMFRLVRGSTPIGVGTSVGSRTACGSALYSPANAIDINTVTMEWLDSPAATTSTTYKVQCFAGTTTTNTAISIGAATTDTNSATFPRTVSTISVAEIHA